MRGRGRLGRRGGRRGRSIVVWRERGRQRECVPGGGELKICWDFYMYGRDLLFLDVLVSCVYIAVGMVLTLLLLLRLFQSKLISRLDAHAMLFLIWHEHGSSNYQLRIGFSSLSSSSSVSATFAAASRNLYRISEAECIRWFVERRGTHVEFVNT